MSVEKFVLTKETVGFTSIPNSVLQGLTNAEALGLWCYFLSMPEQWVFYKDQIKKHFRFGREKLDQLLKKLQQLKLLTMKQLRNDKGEFLQNDIVILNGSEFIAEEIDSPLTDSPHTGLPLTGLPLTANRLLVNDTYKEIPIKETNKKETITPLPPNGGGDDDSFVLPFFIDPELWEEFIKQRRSSKKPMTAFAKKLAINKLVKMRDEGQDVNEVIKQSIINNWSGFFPIKNMSYKGKEQSYAELLFNAYPPQRQQHSEPVPEVSGYLGREMDE